MVPKIFDQTSILLCHGGVVCQEGCTSFFDMVLVALTSARWVVLVVGLVTWIGTVLFVGIGLEGLGTNGRKLFNWHPVLASCAMLVFFPHAFLAWRNPRFMGHVQTKWMHAGLMITAFLLVNIAVGFAVFSHNQMKLANFSSLHSWVGMIAIGTMKGNVFGGLLSTFSTYVRGIKLVWKVHKLSGYFACLIGFTAMLLGFAEVQRNVIEKSGKPYGPTSIIGGGLGLISLMVGLGTITAVLSERSEQDDEVIGESGSEQFSTRNELVVAQ